MTSEFSASPKPPQPTGVATGDQNVVDPVKAAIRRRERRLLRFRQPHRDQIRLMTQCSQAVEDLCETFPAMIFALATGYGNPEKRTKCFELVHAGAPLKSAAQALGLPVWTRKLHPQSLITPFLELPDGPQFNKQISNHIPKGAMLVPRWLESVSLAHAACGDDYCLWVARHYRGRILQRRQRQAHALLTAYAWFSAMDGTTAHKLIRKPWHRMMSLSNALDEVSIWLKRIDLAIHLGNGITDTWLSGGAALGYEFVPLTSIDDFLLESRAMENCLDRYSDQISFDSARVFSVRKDGVPVADLEVGPHEDDYRMPAVDQLKAARNARVDAEIWQAVYAWLGQQKLPPLPPNLGSDFEARDAERKRIWAPFLDAMKPTTLGALTRELINSGQPIDPRHSALSDVFDSLSFDLLVPQRD